MCLARGQNTAFSDVQTSDPLKYATTEPLFSSHSLPSMDINLEPKLRTVAPLDS